MAAPDHEPPGLTPADPPRPTRRRWYRRVRDLARTRRSTDLAWRASVFGLGWTVVGVGVVMLVLPGPGWAAVFLGLAILGSEFAWAHQLLRRSRAWAREAARRASDPAHRRLTAVVLSAGLVMLGVAVTWYLASYGLSLDGPQAWLGR